MIHAKYKTLNYSLVSEIKKINLQQNFQKGAKISKEAKGWAKICMGRQF